MINEFIETCKKNKDKVAFIFKKKSVTFGRLLDDVYKMVNYFKSKNLMPKNRVLLYFTPSYDFYVLIFACVFYGINIVVLDDYKNFKKIRETMVANKIDKVFFNKNTILLKSLFLKGTKGYCVSDYKRCLNSENVPNIGIKSTILTTNCFSIDSSIALRNLMLISLPLKIKYSFVDFIFLSTPGELTSK